MYQALYRKWRPRTFDDVVGQAHITDTLKRQVASGHISHAYLFTGTRGTGKTTCAKILSRAVNCEHPVDGNPCNQCGACRGIENGSILDVLELDAASNNGVDQVRALRDEAVYAPAHVKYRVYIIDEVHMLTVPAFNALLKILEEPPEHLIFILATTELQKVPATILSRCQRYAFKRILPKDIAERLLYVAGQEQIPLTREGADLIARLADGALRDALSLLDQCAAVEGDIGAEQVLEVLGLAGNLQTAKLMELILNRDAQGAILLLHQLYSGGKDVGAVLGELSTLARDLLIRMTAREGGEALLSGGYDTATMDSLAALCNAQRLIHVTSLLQATTAALGASANRRTDAELCLLRLCDDTLSGDLTALAARIARLEEGRGPVSAPAVRTAGVSAQAPAPAAPAPEKKAAAAPPPVEDDIPWEEPPEHPERVLPEEPDAHVSPVSSGASGGDGNLWASLINDYKGRLPAMYRAFLDNAWGTLEGDRLTVICDSDFTKTQLHNVKVQSVLQEVTSAATGQPITVVFQVGELPKEQPQGGAAAPARDKLDDLIGFGSQFDNFKVK